LWSHYLAVRFLRWTVDPNQGKAFYAEQTSRLSAGISSIDLHSPLGKQKVETWH